MLRRSLVLLGVLLLSPAGDWAAEMPAPQWIVVTAPAFRDALKPLCAERQAQGMHVEVVQTTDLLSPREIRAGDARKLRDHVRKLCGEAKGRSYVLLVGAVEPGGVVEADRKVLPPLPGTISRMKGQPSDNGYGCQGEDLLPTVAVGRFPARTEEEARSMVAKTLAYERDNQPGEWRRRLTVLAGMPAYNPFVDKVVESLAIARFSRLDPSWSGRAVYYNPGSRLTLPDDLLHDRALQYVQEGQAATVYLGHSWAQGLYAGKARYLDRDDWAALRIARGPGVLVTFGCNGCQLCGREGEGYGVAAIRNPGGPVAALGSHGICFAAMVQLAGDGFFESFFAVQTPERLGASWLSLKAGLAKGKIDDLSFNLLDRVDGDPKIPQSAQRLEHLEMFVLLGDPALRLPMLPVDIRLDAPQEAVAGKTVTITGELPARLAGARLRLTLERTASSVPSGLEPVPKEPSDEQARVLLANHERSNQFVLLRKDVAVQDGRFQVKLDLPDQLPWPRVIVRAYAATKSQEGMGILSLNVHSQARE